MSLAPLMSSARGDWRTPAHVLDLVRTVGRIALDPCADRDARVGADISISLEHGGDGLQADWLVMSEGGLVFVNSPYGREIIRWVLRCHALGRFGGECIALLPARTDTAWWQRYVATADAICFWRGRLTFVGAPAPAPFPSALAYWGPRPHRFMDVFGPYGCLVPQPTTTAHEPACVCAQCWPVKLARSGR